MLRLVDLLFVKKIEGGDREWLNLFRGLLFFFFEVKFCVLGVGLIYFELFLREYLLKEIDEICLRFY